MTLTSFQLSSILARRGSLCTCVHARLTRTRMAWLIWLDAHLARSLLSDRTSGSDIAGEKCSSGSRLHIILITTLVATWNSNCRYGASFSSRRTAFYRRGCELWSNYIFSKFPPRSILAGISHSMEDRVAFTLLHPKRQFWFFWSEALVRCAPPAEIRLQLQHLRSSNKLRGR